MYHFTHYIWYSKFFGRKYFGWHDVECKIDAAILAQYVSAKTANSNYLVAEIEIVRLLETGELLFGEQFSNEEASFIGIEWFALDSNERAEAAHNRRSAGGEM